MLRRLIPLALLGALLVSGCGTLSALIEIAHPTEVALKTGPRPQPGDMCLAGLYPAFIVHGDAALQPPVWGVRIDTGERVGVIWPFGTRAIFSPSLVVLDQGGNVIAREGDTLPTLAGEVAHQG
jgi:hypothetical protein